VAGMACIGRRTAQCGRPRTETAQGRKRVNIRRGRNFTGPYRESEGFIVPIEDKGQHNPVQGKGPYFVLATNEWRIRRLPWG